MKILDRIIIQFSSRRVFLAVCKTALHMEFPELYSKPFLQSTKQALSITNFYKRETYDWRESIIFTFLTVQFPHVFSTTLPTLFTAGFVHGPGCTQLVLLLTKLLRSSSGQLMFKLTAEPSGCGRIRDL
jgi:hypothetical protein